MGEEGAARGEDVAGRIDGIAERRRGRSGLGLFGLFDVDETQKQMILDYLTVLNGEHQYLLMKFCVSWVAFY